MIKIGEVTVMDSQTYYCMNIENGFAYLQNILHEKGRWRKVKHEEVPHMKDGEWFIPEKKVEKKPRTRSKINLSSLIKDNTDLQVSRSAKNFLMEWVETSVGNMVTNAERNAMQLGHGRISAAHIHWIETNEEVEGYWKENEDYTRG